MLARSPGGTILMPDGYQADPATANLDGSGRSIHAISHYRGDTEPLPQLHESPRPRRRSALWEIVETLILALLIFVAVRSVILNFRVDGLSMEPSLDSGQMLLVNRQVYFHFDANQVLNWMPFVERDGERIVYPFHPPQRGDIVVLHPPVDQGKPYIKRIIALPGERIAIREGIVYINGEPLHEEYLNGVTTSWGGSVGHEEITIPEGTVFVMGDNRNNSTDSRVFGAIEIDEIIGKAWISYWPTDRISIVTSPDYSP
jgi:signal peptidase I